MKRNWTAREKFNWLINKVDSSVRTNQTEDIVMVGDD